MVKLLTAPVLILIAAATGSAADTTVSIALELEQRDSVISTRYSCADGSDMGVQYITAGANALALLEVDEEDRVFVNVISGSGAQYVSGSHIWSTKGNAGTLEDTFRDEDALRCDVDE